MTTKVVKNTTLSDIDLDYVGSRVPTLGSITINSEEFSLWADQENISEITPFINSGDLVVNDGNNDLDNNVGIAHLGNINGVIFEHGDISLYPSIGTMAPELLKITDSVVGHKMLVDEEIFAQTRIDNLAGGPVSFQIHACIDNTVIDRWIQFEISYTTTNGLNDVQMNTTPSIITMGPFEVPGTAFRIFELEVDIPESAFSNEKIYLFIGLKRKTAAGKTAPTNDPVILRYCKQYYKRLET